MAIALGLPCAEGIVICSDGQVPAPSGEMYQEERIASLELFGTAVVSSYAGAPGLWKEAWEQLGDRLSQIQGPEEEGDVCVTPQSIRESADEILETMGRPRDLQMLVAIGGVFNSPELFVFEDGAMHRATGFTCLNVGGSSVVRYLADGLYTPGMSLEAAKNLGIYVISKASQYIPGLGGPTDAVVIRGHQPEWLGDTEIKQRETAMLGREKGLLRQILAPPISSTPTTL